MSQENVEIVRRYLQLDYWKEDPDWVRAFWEPDGDYYPVRKFPEARPCHGREEIAGFLTELLEAWQTYRYTGVDVRAIGADRVLAHGQLSVKGRASGAAVEGDLYQAFWLRHGRFIRVEDHLTLRGALHALGLREDSLEAAGLSE
jgi:hypothetical protein